MLQNAAHGTTLAQYDAKVAALLDAYRTGTPEAMAKHWALTWHQRAWTAMRTYVQIDLGKRAGPDVEITEDDARWLIAREHGFESWQALRDATLAPPPAEAQTAKPIEILARRGTEAMTRTTSRSWTYVLDQLAQPSTRGLDAHGQMTDAMLAQIAAHTHLTTLKLGGSQAVTDAGVRAIARMTNLEHLDLSGTTISDDGLNTLRALPHLTSIVLSWTNVTDAGVPALAQCPALESVNLMGTRCGDASIQAFAGKPTLRHFHSGNAVTDAGLRWFHEYPTYKQWQGDATTETKLGYDAEPNRLLLRGALTDRGIASLRGLDGLFALNLDDETLGLSGAALAPLVDLANLGWLAFDAKDDAMPLIAQMPRLRGLACQDTTATDDGWVALSESQSIENIWGRRCYGLGSRGFRSLARMPKLTRLMVSCKNVSDDALALLPTFPSLREIMPMDVPDDGYQHIGQCDALEVLTLMYCRDTTDVATTHIARLPKLSRYFASYTQITDRTPTLLSDITTLESVTFDSCAALTDHGIASLARLPRLRALRVSGRGLTANVGAPFASTVTVHYGL